MMIESDVSSSKSDVQLTID